MVALEEGAGGKNRAERQHRMYGSGVIGRETGLMGKVGLYTNSRHRCS